MTMAFRLHGIVHRMSNRGFFHGPVQFRRFQNVRPRFFWVMNPLPAPLLMPSADSFIRFRFTSCFIFFYRFMLDENEILIWGLGLASCICISLSIGMEDLEVSQRWCLPSYRTLVHVITGGKC